MSVGVTRLPNGRWALGAAAWAALSTAIWFVGDALVIAGMRPLEGPVVRLALVAFIALLWLGWEWGRVRRALRENRRLLDGLLSGVSDADSAERAAHELSLLRKRFEEALLVLRKARFRAAGGERRTLAQLPWYVFIGAAGSGKTTALLNAGLRFPLGDPRGGENLHGIGGTRNCDWWFTDEAVLLDTAGRYTTQEGDREADAAAWLGFLDLLKKFRPRQPLNGALVTLSLSDLVHWNEEELLRYGAHVRERLAELYRRLGVRVPVYVLVTKSDLLAGFNEFFAEFDAPRRAQVWGATFDVTERAGAQAIAARFDDEFARLERRLYGLLPWRLEEERDLQRRAAIYRFPQQFRVTGPLVSRFLEEAFAGGREGPAPLLRGVYFTSGTQEGSPIDRVLGTLARRFNLERKVQPPAPGTGKSFFIRQLLRDVVFAEAALVTADVGAERRYRLVLSAGIALILAMTVALGGMWTLGYLSNRRLIAEAEADTAAVKRDFEGALAMRAGGEVRLVKMLTRMRELRTLFEPAGMLAVSFGQHEKLGAQADRAYRNALRESLLPHVTSSLERALRTAPSREALEAYLSLYAEGRRDTTPIQAVLVQMWKLPEDLRPDLGRHLRAALEARPLVLLQPPDEGLIQAVRRRLGPGAGL